MHTIDKLTQGKRGYNFGHIPLGVLHAWGLVGTRSTRVGSYIHGKFSYINIIPQ